MKTHHTPAAPMFALFISRAIRRPGSVQRFIWSLKTVFVRYPDRERFLPAVNISADPSTDHRLPVIRHLRGFVHPKVQCLILRSGGNHADKGSVPLRLDCFLAAEVDSDVHWRVAFEFLRVNDGAFALAILELFDGFFWHGIRIQALLDPCNPCYLLDGFTYNPLMGQEIMSGSTVYRRSGSSAHQAFFSTLRYC